MNSYLDAVLIFVFLILPLANAYFFLMREAIRLAMRLKAKANAIKEKMEAQDGIH